ncbi:MAG: synthase subunit delta [Pseudonocardia sp.]|nr:synthase subunit delta [Pseudonocardia sp.]
MAVALQAASREALAAAEARLDDYVDTAKPKDLERLGDALFAVMRLVYEEPTLRRHLADPSVPQTARRALADAVLTGKVNAQTVDVVAELVSARWSRPIDLVEALEVLARRATLGVAEKDGSLDDVEDELFRFGRILAAHPQLRSLLADPVAEPEDRVRLLTELLADKVSPVTLRLLTNTAQTPRGRHLDVASEELAELAALRRDRYVAHVTAPVALTSEQENRLVELLTRLYSRPISLQIELEPELLGGLVVRVGGELMDGSVLSRLAAARRRLPS